MGLPARSVPPQSPCLPPCQIPQSPVDKISGSSSLGAESSKAPVGLGPGMGEAPIQKWLGLEILEVTAELLVLFPLPGPYYTPESTPTGRSYERVSAGHSGSRGQTAEGAGKQGLATAPEALPAPGPGSRLGSLHPPHNGYPGSRLATSAPYMPVAGTLGNPSDSLSRLAAHPDPTCLSPSRV